MARCGVKEMGVSRGANADACATDFSERECSNGNGLSFEVFGMVPFCFVVTWEDWLLARECRGRERERYRGVGWSGRWSNKFREGGWDRG